ncbi:MAG: SpoIIIAC/SpoIIIAD family protein, partial [Clostridia bacterium]|nr:SpoIIIAC/SpoIIIAD family protein [Clostridia bacterium]
MSDAGIIFFLTALAIVVTVVNIFLKQAGREEYAY